MADRTSGASSDELQLLDYAERIRHSEDPRVVVQIHLSRLQSQNRRDHHMRVAHSVTEDLARQFEGELFYLMSQDIVLTARDVAPELLDDMILRLRYLFSEDPLTRVVDDQTGGGFCTWFILPRDQRRFAEHVRRIHELAEAHRRDRARLRRDRMRANFGEQRQQLDPATLARVVEAIRHVDVSPLMRNQSICAVTRRDPPQPVMDELFVSIAELERALIPDIALQGNPWLFQYLTGVLDLRVLGQAAGVLSGGDRAFSLNLNISTVLSREFQKFDQDLAPGTRNRVVVELQKVDVFQDMGAYVFARDFLHERGYKICLDGLTHLTLPYIERERLGLDLLKMYWSGDIVSGVRDHMLAGLRGLIEQMGQSRMIVCRCDSEEALQLAWDLGVTLFQGRHIDQMLSGARKPNHGGGNGRGPIIKTGAIGEV